MNSSTLPVHPLTGVRAVGWRKARPGEDEEQEYPIWPILGAAKDDEEDENEDGEEDDAGDEGEGDGEEDDAGDEGEGDGDGDGEEDDAGDGDEGDGDAAALGEKGQRALARMKEKLKNERKRRRTAEAATAKNGEGDGEDAVRRRAEEAATAKANARIVRSEVRAAAAGKLADPKDALSFIDLDQFEVDEDGQVDEDELNDAIDDLVKNKPYLAAARATRFQGTGDGGAQRKAGRPKQLKERDLETMTPEQIVKAQDEGRLDDLLGG